MLPHDLSRWLQAHFLPEQLPQAEGLLQDAVDHLGKPADDRLLRCAGVGSRGNLESLKYLIGLLKVDYRDVIVAGEYDVVEGALIRIRDLSQPIHLND